MCEEIKARGRTFGEIGQRPEAMGKMQKNKTVVILSEANEMSGVEESKKVKGVIPE